MSAMPADAGMGEGRYLELKVPNPFTTSLFVPEASERPIAYARRGELLVTLAPGQGRRELQRSLASVDSGYRVIREVSHRGVFLIKSQAGNARNPWSAAQALREKGIFQSVEPNHILELSGSQHGLIVPTEQWSIDTLGLANDGDVDGDVDGIEALSKLKYGGRTLQPVVVAIIDSGAAVGHPGLKGSLWVNAGEIAGNQKDDDANGKVDDVHGWNFVGNNGNVNDNNGHGSHVAGIVGAVQHKPGLALGLAPNARLMILKVAEQASVDMDKVISAIDYAVDHSAKIVNMSLAGRQYSQVLYDAIQYAADKDVFVVAAAGNALPGQNALDISIPGNATYPCLMPNVNACVSATNPDGTRGSYSNYSSSLTGPWLLAAPGTAIWSTVPTNASGYGLLSGTSMAAPHVAAVATVLRGLYTSMDRDSVRRQLVLSANAGLRLNFYGAITAPVYGDADDPSTYCNSKVDGTPRKWIVPFASSWEPYFDGTTVERSHRICTLQQMFAMNNYLGQPLHFALVQDLDWMDISEPMRTRIGSSAKPFQGNFHGAGHTLRNYTYAEPLNDLGLFAKIGSSGRISDFRMTNAELKAASSVGILAGINEGVIENVQIEGVVSGNLRVGGIAGVVQRAVGAKEGTGRISYSFFEGRVKGTSTVGGLVGMVVNDALVEASFSKGYVTSVQAAAGGAVGEVSYGGRVTQSLSIAKVQSGEFAGGLVGLLRCGAQISTSFSEFAVSGSVAGGLVGGIENASVRESYSLAIASGTAAAGGLVAVNKDNSPGPTDGTFACTQTSRKSPPSEILQSFYQSTFNTPGAGGLGKTPFELQIPSTYSGWTFGQGAWDIGPQETPHMTGLPRTRTSRY